MCNSKSFSTLGLREELLSSTADLGYAEMTTVQSRCLPGIVAGEDVLGRARTGSGKTAAFGLGLLNALDAGQRHLQALVLCPTRELADQVSGEIRRLARAIPNVKVASVCGGSPIRPQTASLRHGAHIVVGTPGRVLNHLERKVLRLDDLQTLVLDEADRMLDMGFAEELDAILAYAPDDRQTLLFSATYPPSIASISARVQRDPVTVDVTDEELPAQISQLWHSVTPQNRLPQLVRALRNWGGPLNLVFCSTRIDCADVAAQLRSQGLSAIALHGDLDQTERTRALVRFANRSVSVLVATDVAARGLDVEDVNAVFNYELPRQPEVYVHRIGRTGRIGKSGFALSLVAEREMERLRAIEETLPPATLKHTRIAHPTGSARQLVPAMVTIEIGGGRKNKLRAGDILGTLTADGVVSGKAVGSIDVFDTRCFVAVRSAQGKEAVQQLRARKIKGRQYKARLLRRAV